MANKDGFRRVAELVQNDECIKVIVLSAGGKTDKSKKVTDLLLDASERIFGGESIVKSLSQFTERVLGDAEAIGLGNFIEDELMKVGLEVEKDLSLDFILSRGEYYYSKLFSKYYGLPFVDSKDLIGFQKDGNLNMGLCEFQIERAYEKYGRFVCGGFYGSMPNGKIKTFTRGGSDFSGAIAARALKALEYLNYTDVDGIFPFAPSIKRSLPVKEISFDAVRLLGEFGSTVLHPASVLPLYGSGIQIVVKNTFNRAAVGTVVKENCSVIPFAFAIKSNCTYVKMVKRGKGYNLVKRLKDDGVNIICFSASLDFLEFCYEGCFNERSAIEKDLDFCKIQEDVSVLFFTSSQLAIQKISNLQLCEMPLLVSFLECGCYVAIRAEDVNDAVGIVLKS